MRSSDMIVDKLSICLSLTTGYSYFITIWAVLLLIEKEPRCHQGKHNLQIRTPKFIKALNLVLHQRMTFVRLILITSMHQSRNYPETKKIEYLSMAKGQALHPTSHIANLQQEVLCPSKI